MSLLPDLGSSLGGPLVAAPVSVSSPFDGLWLVQDGMALADAIGSGDWVQGGLAAFSLLLDGVATLIDPIGTLIGMGLSWVLEHIWPLNEYLNLLTGNAGEVLRMSQTWANISTHLAGTGQDLQRILGDLDALDGAAVEAYRNFQADMAKHLELAGTLAAATSAGLEIASTIVKIVHDLTRDVISQIAGTAISAALTTVVTVGFGAPVAIAQIGARVAALIPKVTRAIEAVIRSFEKLGPLLKQVDEIYFTLKRLLDRVVPGSYGPTGQHTAGHPTRPQPTTGPPGMGGAGGARAPDAPVKVPGTSKTIDPAEYQAVRDASVHNPDADQVMLGKWFGEENPDTYFNRAGDDYGYFSLGSDWDTIKANQGLTDQEMFQVYNVPFLDDAIAAGKPVQFAHDPNLFQGSMLWDEFKHLMSSKRYRWDATNLIMVPRG